MSLLSVSCVYPLTCIFIHIKHSLSEISWGYIFNMNKVNDFFLKLGIVVDLYLCRRLKYMY